MNKNLYIGNKFQLYGVEEYTLNKGKGKGSVILHCKNGLGLDIYVNTDRGFDISMVVFKGDTLSYLTPNGYVSSKYYDDKGNGFLKSFTAGFLTTCGLVQVGTSNIDQGEELPLHGTYSNIPCSNYGYEDLENEIILKGEVCDETIFSHKLVLKRKIIVSKKSNTFKVIDEINNNGDKIVPFEILYHINLGYPLLDENLQLSINSNKVIARNEHAEKHISSWNQMQPPTPKFEEMCYYHSFNDKGIATAYSPNIKKGITISFDANTLPFLTEWKMMGVRDYVLGIEPGNCYPDGRSKVREDGNLEFINPNESKIKGFEVIIFEK